MHASNIALQNEKREKKKSRLIAFFFALSLGALVFYPLMNAMQPDENPKYESVVTVDFSKTEFEKASKKPSESGTKGGEVKPKKTEKLPVPEVKPPPPAPPVVTTPAPKPPIKVITPKKPAPKKPTKTAPTTVPAPPSKDKTPTPTESKNDTSESTKETKNSKESGSGNGAGRQGNGKASTSSDGDDATPGDGDEGMDFSGDGIFGRRVVYRADVKKMTEEAGKIVVNLCINRTGRVVYAENNAKLSTIKNARIIRKAVDTTKKYRFDTDYTAREKECGKLTFIFELE